MIHEINKSAMFSSIASKYDLLNHLLSFNVDKLWRKKVIALASPSDDGCILDLCTGTGDLAIGLVKKNRKCKVMALDISKEMLEIGERKALKQGLDDRIKFCHGDAMQLPFKDETFDIVTVGFGLRNLPDQSAGIDEMRRVLKKNGKLLILEFAPVQFGLFAIFYRLYLKFILPLIGYLISGSSVAYRYLSDSIFGYIKPEEIINIFYKQHFSSAKYTALLGKIAYIYEVEK